MTVLAAADLGAQSGRVAVGRLDGDRLAIDEVHRFANEPVLVRGRLQWDVLALYRDLLGGLRLAARDTAIDAVGVDSWGVDFGLVDADGQLVANPVHYRDARRAGAVERVLARIPARELYARTGIQLMPINTVFELAAMAAAEDPALGSAQTLLLMPDLLQFWLCGRRVAELTNATTTQCYDPASGGWALDLLARLDVPTGILPEIVPPATVLGPLSPEVADATGAATARVVAGATHDTAAAVAAVPFRQPGSAFLSVGTWSLVGVETREPVTGEAAFLANVTNEGGVEGALPRAPERHRSLAPARVPPRVGRRGQRLLVRRPGRARRDRPAAAVAGRSERARLLRAGRDAPQGGRGVRAHGPARARRARRDRPLHPREPRAQARRDGRARRRGSPARRRPSCTSSAAAPATTCSAAGPRRLPAFRCSPVPRRQP